MRQICFMILNETEMGWLLTDEKSVSLNLIVQIKEGLGLLTPSCTVACLLLADNRDTCLGALWALHLATFTQAQFSVSDAACRSLSSNSCLRCWLLLLSLILAGILKNKTNMLACGISSNNF